MKELFIVALPFFVILQIVILIRFKSKNKTVAFKSTAISFVFYIVLVLLRFLFNLTIPYYALLLTMIAFALNSFVGYSLGYYNKSKVFDRYVHAFGSFTFSLLFYFLLGNFISYGGSRVFLSLYIFALGVAIGTIYEMTEFISDRKNNTKMQRGLKDTNMDIVSNIAGSLTAAILAYWLII